MKFFDDSDQAVQYLRQAIPAMVKYKITPNPLNYTLWYSYFSNAYPALNQRLEEVLERYNTCPTQVSESLFMEHIGTSDSDNVAQQAQHQKAMNSLVSNLSDSISDTAEQSNQYSAALRGDIKALDERQLDEELSPLLDNLSANATAICDVNDAFQSELSKAQAKIEQLKVELQKSRFEANTDPLTGLCNRRVLDTIFNEFVEDRDRDDLSLVIMDIDKFKLFNDTHGHLLGDQILKYVGGLLKKECPKDSEAIRFGGEEFAIICPSLKQNEALDIAEKVRKKLEAVPFTNKKTGEKIPPITASFGVAYRKMNEGLSSIIERADKALYKAKSGGRNQVQVAAA